MELHLSNQIESNIRDCFAFLASKLDSSPSISSFPRSRLENHLLREIEREESMPDNQLLVILMLIQARGQPPAWVARRPISL
jgi:hypothetical protein